MEKSSGKKKNIFASYLWIYQRSYTIKRDLLLAKLYVYGFFINALNLMCIYQGRSGSKMVGGGGAGEGRGEGLENVEENFRF